MDDGEAFELVRSAVIRAKSQVVALAPAQVTMASSLAEPPLYFDSLEFVAMITHLEDDLGLVADDDSFSPRYLHTVADVVTATRKWIAGPEAV